MSPQNVGANPCVCPLCMFLSYHIESWESGLRRADTWVCPYVKGDIFKIPGESLGFDIS